MNMLRISVAVLMIATLGCSKKDSDGGSQPTAATKASLLVKSDWMIKTAQFKQQSATTWTDAIPLTSACQLDDHLVFRADKTYERNEGATKCVASNPFIYETGTWTFAQNETIISMTYNGSPSDMTIESLDASALNVSFARTVSGIVYTYKVSYGH
ncbi:MAG: hypothetical protein JWN78_838 [Bacteroidota bacterium]|nr:hypothetical protein [Bacteroidota bacterium]